MLAAGFHALGRYAPLGGLQVDLAPRGAPRLTGANGSQDDEPETALQRLARRARRDGVQCRAHLGVGQRRVVLLPLRAAGSAAPMPSATLNSRCSRATPQASAPRIHRAASTPWPASPPSAGPGCRSRRRGGSGRDADPGSSRSSAPEHAAGPPTLVPSTSPPRRPARTPCGRSGPATAEGPPWGPRGGARADGWRTRRRASASPTYGYPPSPRSRRLPSTVSRCTQWRLREGRA